MFSGPGTSPWHWHSLPPVRGRRRTPAWAGEGFSVPVSPPPPSPWPSLSLPALCCLIFVFFFPNVAVRRSLTANEVRPLFLRPGLYSRSPYRRFVSPVNLLHVLPDPPSPLTSFVIFFDVNIERAERSVPRGRDLRLRLRVPVLVGMRGRWHVGERRVVRFT